MNLITPSLFYLGPLLVGLPIVLHLIMRQKPKPLEFPALRFIQKQHSSNRRRLRLHHLILLALRALAILFLAGALARPSVQMGGGLAWKFDVTLCWGDPTHDTALILTPTMLVIGSFLPKFWPARAKVFQWIM